MSASSASGGDEGGVPAVAELDDAAEGEWGMAAHQDRDVAAGGLGEDADLVEGEELPMMRGARVAPAGAHDRSASSLQAPRRS